MLSLIVMGAIEAVVHLLRYRSANHPSAVWSACTSFMIACTRVAFVLLGARLVFEGRDWIAGGVAYAASATLTTAALHAWLERRKGRAESRAVHDEDRRSRGVPRRERSPSRP